jgi:hypothetical protein
MTWSQSRLAAERAAEQPVPERERVHHAAPAGTGQRIVGGNVRARAAFEEAVKPTQHEIDAARLTAHGTRILEEREADERREKEQNRARIEQRAAGAKAATDREARRAEFALNEILLASMYSDNAATNQEIQTVNQMMLNAGKFGICDMHYVALMELRARN